MNELDTIDRRECLVHDIADCPHLWDAIKVVAKYYPTLATTDAIQFTEQLFFDNCQGSGFRIINPIWPSGEGEHRKPCAGCSCCRDNEE